MDEAFYAKFLRAESLGLREEAKHHIRSFCDSVASSDEKAAWTRRYLDAGQAPWRIRHELYVRIVGPVLIQGFCENDPWAMMWMVRTRHNLHQARDLHAEIGSPSIDFIVRESLRLAPDDESVRLIALEFFVEGFRYCIHEWPVAILFAETAATLNECQEILDDIVLSRDLDTRDEYTRFLDDVEDKTRQYMERVVQRRNGTNL